MSVRTPLPNERRRATVSAEQRDRFLEALREGFSVTHAARVAGSDRRRLYEQRWDDDVFAAQWDTAALIGSAIVTEAAESDKCPHCGADKSDWAPGVRRAAHLPRAGKS